MNLGIETETLEFKKSTGELKEAMNSISAILNKHQQGEIYFGVKPDGTVIGQVKGMCRHSPAYNTYATISYTNPLFMGFSGYQNVNSS